MPPWASGLGLLTGGAAPCAQDAGGQPPRPPRQPPHPRRGRRAAAAAAAACCCRRRRTAPPRPPLRPRPVPNKGDTAWMIVATALVILMTIPGLALFYGGLVRSKNMLSVLMQVFVIFSLIVRAVGHVRLQRGVHAKAIRSSAASTRSS